MLITTGAKKASFVRPFIICLMTVLASTPAWASGPPNIVFIVLDDLGVGEIQWYPNEPDISTRVATPSDTFSSPTLFQLAKEGVRFTNYHSPATVCSQTRAALLTGRYPQEFNLHDYLNADSGRGLTAGIPTIASLLKTQSGYATAHFGKWHVGEDYPHFLPVHFGFDESLVPELGSGSMGNTFTEGDDIAGAGVINANEHTAATLTNRAIQFIEASEATGQPYYLNLWYKAPHSPLDPPGNFPASPTNINTFSQWPSTWSELVSEIPELSHLAYLQNHSSTRDAKQRAMYIAMVAWVDYQIGRLIKRIDELDPSGNTLIVVTSDNGAVIKNYSTGTGTIPGNWEDNGLLEKGKWDVYEGGLRAPLIVRWLSEGLAQGSVISDLTLGYDFLPTMLDTSNALATLIDPVGVSFNDRLHGQGPMPTRTASPVWEIRWASGFWPGTDTTTTLDEEQNRYAVWNEPLGRKLVVSRDLAGLLVPQLFDVGIVNIDGVEEGDGFNISETEPGVVNALEDDYRDWRMQVGPIPFDYNLAESTADFNQECIDFPLANDVVELESNEQFRFRGGDFTFQARVQLDALPTVAGDVVAVLPESWSLALTPGSTANTVSVSLLMTGNATAGIDYPGLPGDTVAVSGELACAVPCDFNVAFTVLGFSGAESSVRLYLDGVPVAEYKGDRWDSLDFREVYANDTATILLGNDASGQSGITGTIIDPRIFRMNLTPMEIAMIDAEQSADVCVTSNGCHP